MFREITSWPPSWKCDVMSEVRPRQSMCMYFLDEQLYGWSFIFRIILIYFHPETSLWMEVNKNNSENKGINDHPYTIPVNFIRLFEERLAARANKNNNKKWRTTRWVAKCDQLILIQKTVKSTPLRTDLASLPLNLCGNITATQRQFVTCLGGYFVDHPRFDEQAVG